MPGFLVLTDWDISLLRPPTPQESPELAVTLLVPCGTEIHGDAAHLLLRPDTARDLVADLQRAILEAERQ